MSVEEAFVERQIVHCLGSVAEPGLCQDGPALSHAKEVSAGGALLWDARAERPDPWNSWTETSAGSGEASPRLVGPLGVNHDKHLRSVSSLRASGLDFDAIIDMRDCRTRPLRLQDGTLFPVFSFHRHTARSDRVIWPLPGYQDLEDVNFLGHIEPDQVPLARKVPKVTWRGIPGGRAYSRGGEGVRIGPVLRNASKGKWTIERARAILSTFPRHRFVERLYDDPRADVGFVDQSTIRLSDYPLLRNWQKPRLTRPDMQKSRYLAVVRGNDLASNFFWTMNSGSLALVMDSPFESFASCHFKPWVHFLPFKEDMSDFDKIYDWAEANLEECQEMCRRAADICRLLARGDLRQRSLSGVISKLGSAIRRKD